MSRCLETLCEAKLLSLLINLQLLKQFITDYCIITFLDQENVLFIITTFEMYVFFFFLGCRHGGTRWVVTAIRKIGSALSEVNFGMENLIKRHKNFHSLPRDMGLIKLSQRNQQVNRIVGFPGRYCWFNRLFVNTHISFSRMNRMTDPSLSLPHMC